MTVAGKPTRAGRDYPISTGRHNAGARRRAEVGRNGIMAAPSGARPRNGQFLCNMKRKTYGIVIATAALLAVTAWLLDEAWRAQPVDTAESAALEEQLELNVRAMQDALSERVSERTGSEEQERIDSPRGQALFRRCADWSELFERAPTPANRDGRDSACAVYRQYVLTGEAPDP